MPANAPVPLTRTGQVPKCDSWQVAETMNWVRKQDFDLLVYRASNYEISLYYRCRPRPEAVSSAAVSVVLQALRLDGASVDFDHTAHSS